MHLIEFKMCVIADNGSRVVVTHHIFLKKKKQKKSNPQYYSQLMDIVHKIECNSFSA